MKVKEPKNIHDYYKILNSLQGDVSNGYEFDDLKLSVSHVLDYQREKSKSKKPDQWKKDQQLKIKDFQDLFYDEEDLEELLSQGKGKEFFDEFNKQLREKKYTQLELKNLLYSFENFQEWYEEL